MLAPRSSPRHWRGRAGCGQSKARPATAGSRRVWSRGMHALLRAALIALLLAQAPAVSAETLRCNGASAAEGDSKLSVRYKCGPPLLAEAFCAPVFALGSPYPVPEPWSSLVVPCQPVEEWL